ncbi:SIALI-17 repeat-containing surface protein [Streptococcus mitis]|nr:SIALI-17 repeat-containing surface protein [Streptococcus mitis]
MFFNRKGINQKNWRMIKKGKHFLFGCTLFLATGAVTIQNPHLVHADEMVASLNDSTKVKDEDPNSDKIPNDVENHPQVENPVKESDKISEHVPEEKILEKSLEHPVKAVDKTALNELIEKIRNTDLQTKTAKSVENLNLSLSRAQAVLDKEGASQDEIDKEVQALSESFAQLEEKSNDIDKKEKQADKANDSDEKKNPSTEKIAKVQALVSEINQLAGEISYEFSESESKSLQVFADLSEGKATESEVDGALNEAKSLRNKVANRVTRAQSGKRDPRNGKPIDGKGESGFRAIWISSIANKYEGSNALVNENKKELTFYNSDTLFSVMTAYGKRGNGEPLVRYPNGPKRGEEDPTPYYVKRVGVISGLNQVKGLKLRVAYKNFQTGKKEEVDIAANYWNVNNPEVQMALVGTIGDGGNVTPGTYHITIGANGTHKQNTITYTLTIKPQSERNTVRDLTPTYVDDVRHLTETEKNALIEKFKAEHPNVVNRANHIDFDHAEVSADGATMTIHFKDGFNPKTIQTNATNDVEAKHSSLTAYFGDSKELYTNPRELVRSKTGHEVPTTAQVTYKTPFNLQEAGTRNVVVTTTYENGVTKDVTTPYTVLDFLGKQDKKINQNQSGQLGDARNYVTVSDNSAVPGELTVRWKGGSSNVDTSAAGVQHKEIEILRGSHLMKTVNVPVEIVDNIKPTITAPDNITLTRLEGLPSEINIHAQDNDKGVGLKESNSVTVDNLPNPLSYNAKKSKIEINGVIPNNFQLGKSSIQVTVKAVDKKENTATKNITFHIQSQTQKYTAVANSQIQEVSYGEAPDAGTSIQKNGLPTGTRYGWATQPNTATGPGDQTGVVTVTYPDGSTDTVPVTVKVRKLSDEHTPTGNKITVNQSESVTNDRLKAAVTVNNGGTSKVKSVTASPISTVHAGPQTIKATVTYLDNTTDPVDIPLEVKDVTKPTIQTPSENQTWEITALDKTLPPIKVAVADNPGGSGIKSIVPMNLPSFLKYDKATSSIVFQDGEREVPKLSGRTRTTRNITLRVEDNAGNSSERTFSITHMPMAEKYNPQANATIQEVSHGETPNPKTSVNTAGLPTDAQYTWKSAPDTNRPGNKTGVVKVTYPDDSVDEVTVTVKVRKLSDEYEPTATKIVKNQNDTVSEQDLKSAVTINKNGNSKVKTVTPVGKISTAETGNKEISATVTYLDDTRDTVTIPLEVKDVTAPTIQTPANGQNIDLIALDKAFSPIKVTSEDNAGGSGVRSTTVTDLPDFLTYDDATKTIKFKEGTKEVPKLPVGTDSQTHTATIRVTDNANNSSTSQLTFTVKSMTTKYEATPNPQKQTVSYGEIPDAGTSVNKTNLPEGTSYAWKTTPVTTDVPGEKDGVVEVTYKDGSKDTVDVKVTVKELSSEYEVTGAPIEVNQNDPISNDDLKAKVTATSTVGSVNGTDKISTVEPTTSISTANYGEKNITATVTFKDGTTKEVTIPLKVKDVTKPTISAPVENTNWEMTALDKALPNMEVRAEDNANGSGIKNVTVTGLPDYLEYDSTTNTIKFKSGKQAVEKLPENTPSQEFTLNIRAEDKVGNVSERTAKITVSSMSAKKDPTPIPQNTSYGQVPAPNASVDKAGLPDGTKVTWKTPPVVNTPGTTTGVVEVTYPDGSKDTVTVNVTVRKVSEDFTSTGTQIEINQNVSVTPEMLKGAVTATNAQGERGNAKIATVEAKTPINTEAYGDQTIQAKVTYIDGSEQDVTIPLKVKDVTDPTIQTPAEHTNWGMTALDKTLPPMKIEAEDNANGSGIATIEVRNMPSFLTFDQASGTIVFKEGVREVPRIDSDNVMYGVTIVARDKAGNSTSKLVKITVSSMRGKYSPTAIAQEVDNGHVPDPEISVNKTGLPDGTTVTWKTRPDVSTPGSHPGVALVHYPDGTEDEVEVPVTVKKQSDTFNPTAKEPNQTVRHNEVPDPEKSINTNDLPAGTNYSWSEQPDTSKPGSKIGKVLITYPDHSTEEVTVTVNVTPQNDEYTPTGIAQTVDNGHVPDPETSVNKTGLPEGTTVTWKETPVVNTPGSHPGVALVTYPDGTEDEVEVPVRVKEQKDTFNPTAKEPNQTVRHNEVPDPEKSINTNDLPKGTNYSWSEQPDTSKPGSKTGKVLITYPDKSTEEVTVTVNVTPQNDEYTPTGIPQEVDNGHVPDPETSVTKTGLPEGTTVTWKDTPVVNTPGSHPGVALVHYPDGTEDEVEVPVTVKKQSDTFNPTAKEPNQTVRHNEVPDPEKSINTNDLPAGTNYSWSEQPDTSKPGNKPGKVLITYPDNSTEEVPVTVEVTPQKDEYNPTAIAQEVDNGHVPDPETSVNKTGLPEGTSVTWKTRPDVSTPGSKTGKVLITYPDKSTEEVTVTVNVTPQNDEYTPTGIPQEVDNGHVPDPETSVTKTGLPEGTTVTWKTRPDVSTPGSHPGVALVHYPDGTEDEVEVPVRVKEQKDTFNPTAKEPNQTVRHNEVPDPEKSINTNDLPKGTNYSWSEQPDTSKPGSKTGKVLITYPDKSTEEVTVTVEVTPQKDDYDPQPKTQTVEHAQVPSAKDSIENVKTLPEGTTFGWKDGKIPDTSKHGEKKGVVTVTYPDGSTEDVDVVITVNPEDFSPVVPMEKVPVKNPENLSPEEQDKVKEKVTKANPGKDVTVDSKGNVTITDPETKVSHEISRDKLVFAYAKGEPETSKIPEFNGGVNAPDSPVHEVPEFAGGVNGEPEIQETLPEFNGGVNAPNSPTHEVPEFNGGVNGELPDPVEVSKIQLMITKWVDENGKELKPADAKAPKVLGEANEAFEHGEIEGYVFVRTETKGDVVTHIFRKVSPVRPTGDGQQRPATPSDDTNPRPDIATPTEVPATQAAGQPSQIVAMPAQLQNEVSETNPSVSQTQAVLPNTGIQEDRTTGTVGVLSLLGAFGLLFAKKKKDDEEEA